MSGLNNNIAFSRSTLLLLSFLLLGVLVLLGDNNNGCVVQAAGDGGPWCVPYYTRKEKMCRKMIEECNRERVLLKWTGKGCRSKL